MRAITLPSFGDESVLTLTNVDAPTPGEGEVLVKVAAAGINRADIVQRQGNYPPPPGESELPGLEVSGVIESLGEGVTGWNVGDEVCALLAGGGYAEYVAVPAGQLLPVPSNVSPTDAAGLPEVATTVWSNLFFTADLHKDEVVLIHGGSSGIGTMAIQMAKAFGAVVAVTAGSQEKLDACSELGADFTINYKDEDFVEVIQGHGGANVILDMVGGAYLDRNLDALAAGGRLVIIGLQGGRKAEIDLSKMMKKRAALAVTSLRSRPRPEKAAIVAQVREQVWPLIESGQIKPIIQSRYPMDQVADAHREMAASQHIGKIVLTMD